LKLVDLSIGNPSIFSNCYRSQTNSEFNIHVSANLGYNKQGMVADLTRSVKDLHNEFHGNSNLVPDENTDIVAGHGATQLLMGLLQYIKTTGKALSVPTPYWFRILKMADMRGAPIRDGYNKLITLPNNPDGASTGVSENDYLDSVYHWPWYYSSTEDFKRYTSLISSRPKIAIFSLGKMSGHCGTRLGWAQINDPKLAAFMRDYIEYDAGGVSIEAQLRGASIIDSLLHGDFNLNSFSEILNSRKEKLVTLANALGFKYDSKSPGMFAWLTHSDTTINALDLFKELGVKVTPGTLCGGRAHQCRLNLGEPNEVWKEFCEKVMDV
jgi:aspartate/methionine/tyrosine aminotransferase